MPGLPIDQKAAYVKIDEDLYGLILTCLETTVGHDKASDKQKADAREMYGKVDEDLYGLILTCLETTVGHDKASDKQKADAR